MLVTLFCIPLIVVAEHGRHTPHSAATLSPDLMELKSTVLIDAAAKDNLQSDSFLVARAVTVTLAEKLWKRVSWKDLKKGNKEEVGATPKLAQQAHAPSGGGKVADAQMRDLREIDQSGVFEAVNVDKAHHVYAFFSVCC